MRSISASAFRIRVPTKVEFFLGVCRRSCHCGLALSMFGCSCTPHDLGRSARCFMQAEMPRSKLKICSRERLHRRQDRQEKTP